MNIALTAGSLVALTVLCGQALAAAGIRRRPDDRLRLPRWPCRSRRLRTAAPGRGQPILAALDLARIWPLSTVAAWFPRRQGRRTWRRRSPGWAALPVILLATWRDSVRRRRSRRDLCGADGGIRRAARPPDVLAGRLYDQNRIGDPMDQSLPARCPGWRAPGPPRPGGWRGARVGLAGLAVAVWAHRRGCRVAGRRCAVTGLLVSPISWTHHWVGPSRCWCG